MRLRARSVGISLTLLFCADCAGAGDAPARRPAAGPAAPPGAAYAAQVLECAPAEVPASLLAEQAEGADRDRAAARFEEVRGIALTTLGLYLGTGRWAGAAAEIRGEPRPARPGSEDECRALRALAAGRTPPSFPVNERARVAVAGTVDLAYLPAQGARPAQLLVRLGALLVDEEGAVLRAAPAEVKAPYAGRGAQEIAQDLVEQAVRALGAAMR